MKEHNVKDLTNRYYLHTMCVSTAKKIGITLLLSTIVPVSMLHAGNKREILLILRKALLLTKRIFARYAEVIVHLAAD